MFYFSKVNKLFITSIRVKLNIGEEGFAVFSSIKRICFLSFTL